MLENVNYNANNKVSKDETRIKSSDFAKRPSFKANPDAVDNTPTKDTYSPQAGQTPPEEGFGRTYLKYGVPAGMTLYAGSELFNKVNGGAYEKSLLGRLGRFGDWLSGTKLIRNSYVEKLTTNGRAIKNNLKTFISEHEPLRVMAETPTRPESPMVVGFLETQEGADLKEGFGKFKDYLNKNPKTLKLAGATDAEIAALKTKFGTGLFGRVQNEKAAVEEFLIDKIGRDLGHPDILARVERGEQSMRAMLENARVTLQNPALSQPEREYWLRRYATLSDRVRNYRSDILRGLKTKSAGMSARTLRTVTSKPEAHGAIIERALESARRYNPKLAEQYNKVRSISAPSTKLGKLLPKAAKLGMRGLTFGGGFLNCLLMLGFFMSEPVKTTIEAPKEKKVATGVHGFFDAMSWVISMPIALKVMHAVNGLKNLGKSKAQVDTFKTALKVFNDKAEAGLFKSHAAYNRELEKLMSLKNAGTAPKGLGKLFSKVAQFLSVGLEQISPFKRNTANLTGSAKKAALMGNITRKIPNFLKNCAGYPLRFALYMFAFQPIVDKLFSGVVSAFVGKPYDPEKAKEEAEKNALRTQATNVVNPGWFGQVSEELSPYAKAGLDNLDMSTIPDNNLIKQELQKQGISVSKFDPSKPSQNPNTYTNNVNGVSVSVQDVDASMPQGNPNGIYPNGSNGGVINNNGQKDPNKSDYDTVPLNYEPVIDYKNPIPYGDPSLEQNVLRTQELTKKGKEITDEIDKIEKKKS